MNVRKSRKPLLLIVLLVVALVAIIFGIVIPSYAGPKAQTGSRDQSSSAQTQSVSSGSLMTLSRTIPLPSTQGRIDHMSVDLPRGLLFVAGYGNNTVGIVDIKSGQLVRSIGGFDGPQGVAWVADAGRLFVSNAGDGVVDVFEGNSFAPAGKITLPGDADNMRYDPGTKLLYVGYGSGGIAAINTTSNSVVMTSALSAHPESFQVEADGRAIYVNVPSANLIVAIDKITGKSILSRSMSGSNFPMALDEIHSRLFVATRSPPSLMVLDTSTPSLRAVANVTIAGDPDDVFYDSAHGLVYVSCGQGSFEVIRQTDVGRYSLVQTVATSPGARTSLFVPEFGTTYVAAPSTASQQGAILVYVLRSTEVSSATSIAPIPTSASLSASPAKGPSGAAVTLSGSGYVPGVRYQVCVGALGKTGCGFEYTSAGYSTAIGAFASLGSFIADPAGNIPTGTKVTLPDLFGGEYLLWVVPDGKDVFLVSAPLIVESPMLSMGAVSVVAQQKVTLTGSGYAPSTTYTVCMVPVGTVDCGYAGDREETPPGLYLGTFTADSSGSIPPGTTVSIPSRPAGRFSLGIFFPTGGYILISQVEFTLATAR